MSLKVVEKMTETDISVMLSVERGLDVLGESGKETTLRHMEMQGIERDRIPFNVESFVTGLGAIFGKSSVIIESEIVENLRLMEHLPAGQGGLVWAVRELKRRETISE